jgi:hypothetical protein
MSIKKEIYVPVQTGANFSMRFEFLHHIFSHSAHQSFFIPQRQRVTPKSEHIVPVGIHVSIDMMKETPNHPKLTKIETLWNLYFCRRKCSICNLTKF